MNDFQHEPECKGYHMPEVGCLWVMAQQEAVAQNIWHCPASGQYHSFDDWSDECLYGCGRLRPELEADL